MPLRDEVKSLTSYRHDIGSEEIYGPCSTGGARLPPAVRPTDLAVHRYINKIPRRNKFAVLTAFNNNSPILLARGSRTGVRYTVNETSSNLLPVAFLVSPKFFLPPPTHKFVGRVFPFDSTCGGIEL